MKKLGLLLFCFSWSAIAQVNTEIHVFDIRKAGNQIKLENGLNISNNIGYDNQPSFYQNNQVLFSYSRNGFTDIACYDLTQNSLTFFSETQKGGEYSPQPIPNSDHISAVRLDDNGYQRLYKYDTSNGTSSELIANLKVAYPNWYDESTLVASVIVGEKLELFVCDVVKNECLSIAKNVGRSVKNIPGTNLVSFVSQDDKKNWVLKSFNPISKSIKTITSLGSTEDIAWMPDGTLLFPKGKRIYKLNPSKEKVATLWWSFIDEEINNISRMSVNAEGTKIAITAEVSPSYLAQEQLEAYNKRDIEAFLKPYATNIKVFKYPNTLNYEGIDNMRKRYEPFFKNTPDLHCKLLKRIVHGNQVIDHELVTINGRQVKAVAIYTMKDGKIASVTFL